MADKKTTGGAPKTKNPTSTVSTEQPGTDQSQQSSQPNSSTDLGSEQTGSPASIASTETETATTASPSAQQESNVENANTDQPSTNNSETETDASQPEASSQSPEQSDASKESNSSSTTSTDGNTTGGPSQNPNTTEPENGGQNGGAPSAQTGSEQPQSSQEQSPPQNNQNATQLTQGTETPSSSETQTQPTPQQSNVDQGGITETSATPIVTVTSMVEEPAPLPAEDAQIETAVPAEFEIGHGDHLSAVTYYEYSQGHEAHHLHSPGVFELIFGTYLAHLFKSVFTKDYSHQRDYKKAWGLYCHSRSRRHLANVNPSHDLLREDDRKAIYQAYTRAGERAEKVSTENAGAEKVSAN